MLISNKQAQQYLSAINPDNHNILLDLQHRMTEYYTKSLYHSEWIKGINCDWQYGIHDAQLAMCKLIPNNSAVLEVACGDGSSAKEITSQTKNITYTGVDLEDI
ncbi:class I SAM-dependent methyltransferase [Moorena sp. SIO4A5]|uniref:class I SAM-dependent methyltransferase n=1 Tax=Moorena sp. SIO4A5 TaxID=2607838 RepID=UPI0013BA9E33|nr:class I SAM-dependent methyltransferase [Moorena sp. SIO4A5]NEO21432.1 class I SAM-dependent methyltransferase [Moorena sp. SIO4A5]NEQ86891.1 class I SAM-dependent methyltransferase [Moorena sp. SIO2I5]